MTQSHIKQNLPLKNQVIPVDANTIFLAHYDLNENDVLKGISPIGNKYGLFFNGTSDYINTGVGATVSNTFGIEAWVNPSVSGQSKVIAGKQSEYGLILSSGYVKFVIWGNDWVTTYIPPVGVWTHLAIFYMSGYRYLFVNGVQHSSIATTGSVTYNATTKFCIGKWSDTISSENYFNGGIGEVRYWVWSRTAAEIAANVDTILKGDELGLAGYWRLNEGSGLVAIDKSQYANNAIITGGRWGYGRQVATITSQGYYGGGIVVEEGTTNLWNSDYVIYNNFGVPYTMMQTGETYLGAPVWRIGMTVTDAYADRLYDFQNYLGNHGIYGGIMPWVENVSYVSSIYWRPINKLDMVLGGTASNTGGWSSGGSEILSDGWRRFHRFRTGVGVATKSDSIHHSIMCPSLQLNETIYFEICGAQTEQGKRFPTSYIPPTMTRASGKLDYSIQISRPSTISFWVQPRVSDNYNASVNWVMGQNPYSDNFLLWKRVSENYYRLRVSGTDVALSPGDITEFTWSHVTIVFDLLETRIYINGIQKGTCGVLAPISILALGYAEGQNAGNNIFDELRIDKVARTSDEILTWYYSNSPFWPKGIYRASY